MLWTKKLPLSAPETWGRPLPSGWPKKSFVTWCWLTSSRASLRAKALDLTEAAPIEKHDAKLTGTNGYEATAGSEIVIITAGIPRKPGMSRDDLISTNAGIIKSVTQQIATYSPEAVLIIVSNPSGRHVPRGL
jgi:malate/lactate dehydrogenase